jgi:hypothetical protein
MTTGDIYPTKRGYLDLDTEKRDRVRWSNHEMEISIGIGRWVLCYKTGTRRAGFEDILSREQVNIT